MNSSSTNISEVIAQSINSLFGNLFSSIDNSIYLLLDEVTFIDTDILSDNFLLNIFGENSSSGILLISNSLLISFIIFYCIKLIYSYFTFSNTEKPLQFLFKLLIFGILMNGSFFICEQLVNINSLISSSIREIGENIFSINMSFSELIKKLNDIVSIGETNFNLFSMDGLLKSFICLELITLLFTYSLRYILIKIFILISPFAFLSLISNSSNWLFKSWFKSFFALLIIQSFVSIILLLIFSIDISSNEVLSKILYICSLYALTKANVYIKELIGGISTNFSNGIYTLKSIIK